MQKNTKRKRLRGKCKYWQKSVKTEQQVKIDFFENLMLLRSENPELRKVVYISLDYAQNISGRFDFSKIYYELNGGQQKSVSCAEIQIYSINFPLETLLGSTIRKSKDTEELLQK